MDPHSPPGTRTGLRFSGWNLLLIVPLLMLITPAINLDAPRVLGLPMFYWIQFLFVPVGVICVGVVHAMTRENPTSGRQRDEGDDRP